MYKRAKCTNGHKDTQEDRNDERTRGQDIEIHRNGQKGEKDKT